MKPSKVLKEYIETKVKEAYGEETQIEKDYAIARKEFEDKIKEINIKVKEYAMTLAQEMENPYDFNWYPNSNNAIYDYNYSGKQPQIYLDKEKAKQERLNKITTTINDILIELELGGTKAQLEERLANLK